MPLRECYLYGFLAAYFCLCLSFLTYTREGYAFLAGILFRSYAAVHVSTLDQHGLTTACYSYRCQPLFLLSYKNLIKNSPGLAHSISGRCWQAQQNGFFSLVSESVWLCFEVLGNEVAGYTCECHYVAYFGHSTLEIFRALYLFRNLFVSCKNIHGQSSSL